VHLRSKALTEQDKAVIHRATTERYPGYPLEFLIDLNTDAISGCARLDHAR
jgi:hypothetical protein